MTIKIRYRAPSGGGTLDLDDDATVAQLFESVQAKTGAGDVTIKYGWPPKALAADQAHLSVLSLNLHRESLTVVPGESAAPAAAPAAQSTQSAAVPSAPMPATQPAKPKDIHDRPVTVRLPTDTYLGTSNRLAHDPEGRATAC